MFCLYEADGEYFDISDPAHIVRDSFTIGREAQEAPGYYVGEGCIGCKLCYSVCHQKCIDITKKPVVIDQHCDVSEIPPCQNLHLKSLGN